MIRTSKALRVLRFAANLLFLMGNLLAMSWSQAVQPHVAVGIVRIISVTRPRLAEPTTILLQSNGPKVISVSTGWAYQTPDGFVVPPYNENGDILPVSYDSSGRAYISVTPRRLGKVQLTLFVSFADGGIERKTVDIQVDQPARPPEKLTITYGGGDNRRDHDIISMDLSDPHRRIDLFAAAIFKNLSYPVPLRALDVSFKWISPGGVAQIDPSTGIVTALNLGQALLETTFAGVSTLTCIDVKKNVAVASRSGCAELLPRGRSLPPMDLAPPPLVKVRGKSN